MKTALQVHLAAKVAPRLRLLSIWKNGLRARRPRRFSDISFVYAGFAWRLSIPKLPRQFRRDFCRLLSATFCCCKPEGLLRLSMYLAANDRYKSLPYARCGRSGLQLPRISLGLWQNFGARAPFENAREMVLKSFDRGITHFDLANNYGPPPGSAEENF
ncbi:MAG: aldo/keto reductase, partial [Acetobacteraceae bacterium]|nr:aldo/keto reductase [Acetobacteraceae bacterium]